MKETRFFYVPDAATRHELPPDEAQHAVRVLRLQAGDEVMLLDGCGSFYRAELTLTGNHHCAYSICERLPQQRQWGGSVQLAIAPTKMMERMEWLAEKAVEVGVDRIVFLDCQFSERRSMKLPRLEKIVVAAMKQSRKPWITQLEGQTPFDRFIEHSGKDCRCFIAHCYEEIPRTYLYDELCQLPPDADVMVLVGPEGDFSISEVRQAVAAGFRSVHLGASRLRTETAGLTAVMMTQIAKTKY
jgi:16S rRNA (uracil1498-N3)-methyltransferase